MLRGYTTYGQKKVIRGRAAQVDVTVFDRFIFLCENISLFFTVKEDNVGLL